MISSVKVKGLDKFIYSVKEYSLNHYGKTFQSEVKKVMRRSFKKVSPNTLNSWKYLLDVQNGEVLLTTKKRYLYYLSKGRKSQAMKWLEGRLVPIKTPQGIIFRWAKGVGRPNKNSKWGRLFYMKDPDKNKRYLRFIDYTIDLSYRLTKKHLKSSFGIKIS